MLKPALYPLWENIALPIAAWKDQLDILHCLGNTAPFLLPNRVKLVLSLMDVMFLQTGSFVPKPITFYQKLGRLYRAFSVPFVARFATRLITISEYSRIDIINSISRIKEIQVNVTHLSCDPKFLQDEGKLFTISADFKKILNDKYVLCLGAEDPRKNTLRLVKAYLKLLKQNAIKENLVISGYTNWEISESYKLVKEAGAGAHVKFLGFVTIEELAQLYRKAKVFVYPSLYEGFGIPILEAFSSGCPVIASNVTSIPEVGGYSAVYFDPLNEEEMSHALLTVLHDEQLQEALKKLGYSRAEKFTWKETARKTLQIYKDVVKTYK
jgi:glycosyltransferase involved in cell wall biosynthesis